LKIRGLRPAAVLAATATALAVGFAASSAGAGSSSTYVVLYNQAAVPASAASTIQSAGGTLVYSYSQIGVAIARSDSSSFAATLSKSKGVEGVTATSRFGTRVKDNTEAGGATVASPVNDSAEPLSPLQWDMRQISAPEAHAITGGSPSIIAGDIDTGLDFTHPDIAPNYDAANSTDCSSGAPAPLVVGNDQAGHGTHTAGTIAAAANGIGIVGVAPGVKIAGIKSSTDDGFFFPEMVICSFIWAATHGIDVTNNSYFADPWLFNCRNDPGQRAIWIAERRAIRFAINHGVTVVAAEGNENIDLSKQNTDDISPDFPPGSEQERNVTNACVVIPVEIPGVIGVTANGNRKQKSFYSSYGVGVTDVVAPGGDSIFQVTAEAPNGRVLSTWPPYLPCTRKVVDPSGATYCYLQGTSMASPHVAGVAALIESAFGEMSPGAVAARIGSTADSQPCPSNPFLGGTGFDATCVGGAGYNGFYGQGQVNALKAIGG